jgi:glucose-fructose oxidoreductase
MDHEESTASPDRKIRYAVVGLGHITQAAVLPAFAHAHENFELTALVSSDAEKLKKLGRKYRIAHKFSYDEYEACLRSGEIDAVYIALPNHLHREYAVRAAEAGIHVLCEKPMAVTEAECHAMIEAAESHKVQLMIAYRLHFEEANLTAIDCVRSGELGDPKYFSSSFSMQAKGGGIRLKQETGGGTLYDIGIYCINAARYLFGDEPIEVFSWMGNTSDSRFNEVDEMATAVLRFPGDRLATFTCSFGAANVSEYRIVGAQGNLRVEPAYDYSVKLAHYLTLNGKTKKTIFVKRDQFAAELVYFSRCVATGNEPEPNGLEGLADVRIIEALNRSATENRPIEIEPIQKTVRPTPKQEIHCPAVKAEPKLVHAAPPHHG